MAAMHFAGIEVQAEHKQYLNYLADPVAYTISANIHRRHLNKHEKADLIVRAVKAGEKLAQVEPVSAGGRGKVNKVKAKAVAEAEKVGISEATVKRALAKAEGKQPKPKPKPKVKSKYWGEDTDDEQGEGCNFDPTLPDNDAEDMAACRRRSILWRAETAKEYAENQAGLNGMDSADPSEIDMEIVNAAAAAGAAWVTLAAALREKQASTLPQDGRPSSDRDKGR
jgi:hypothetical protein